MAAPHGVSETLAFSFAGSPQAEGFGVTFEHCSDAPEELKAIDREPDGAFFLGKNEGLVSTVLGAVELSAADLDVCVEATREREDPIQSSVRTECVGLREARARRLDVPVGQLCFREREVLVSDEIAHQW
jgi:hypothetical protein